MSTAIEDTAAEIAAIEPMVDRLGELIEESDRLLDWLEIANREGRKALPRSARDWLMDLDERVRGEQISRSSHAARFVQSALDHVFDVIQPPLFDWRSVALGLFHCDTLTQLERTQVQGYDPRDDT